MTATENETVPVFNFQADDKGAAAFLAAMLAEPGDATTLLVAADYFEENRNDAKTAKELREIAVAVRKAWAEWVPFAKRLAHLENLMLDRRDRVPIKSAAHLSQKELAEAIRALFAELQLRNVSVTCARGSMCFWVDVTLPSRLDCDYLRLLDTDWEWRNDPSNKARQWAERVVAEIINTAFPGNVDRSDLQSDYFNYSWSIKFKGNYDYREKPKRVKKVVIRPAAWDEWKTMTVGGAEYKVEPGGTINGARYTLHAVKGESRYALIPNYHTPHLLYVAAFGPKVRGGWKCGKVRGHDWFTDLGGELRPCE